MEVSCKRLHAYVKGGDTVARSVKTAPDSVMYVWGHSPLAVFGDLAVTMCCFMSC